jgi:hypothetical protein
MRAPGRWSLLPVPLLACCRRLLCCGCLRPLLASEQNYSPLLWLRRRRLALDVETAADDDIGVAAGGDGVVVVLLVALLLVCAAVAS